MVGRWCTSGGIPDMAWINRSVSVLEVAQKLGLEIANHERIRCWHPDRHHNGDRTASVGVRKMNNTVKCFGIACGIGPFGPIDLVKDVLNVASPQEAFGARENLPTSAFQK